jgi:sulfate transport system substrate-binding protein
MVTALTVVAAATIGLSACGGSSDVGGDGGSKQLNVVGFSVIKSAYEDLGDAFARTSAGSGVTLRGSYGASGAQSRAVIAGQKADVVAFSLEPDLTNVVDAGKVDAGWNAGPTKGIASSSVVVIAFRTGNPKGIKGWADIVKPGVGIVTADPGTSGAAKWNLLAAYAQAAGRGNDEAAGQAYLQKFIKNVVSWNDSGRGATDAFSKGTGDVLISYENEAIAARKGGVALDYVVPASTFLIQNPAAVTTTAPASAKAFLDFVESAEGQKLLAADGFRPVVDGVTPSGVEGANDPASPFPTVSDLRTIDDLGGWKDANKKFFDKAGGIVTKLRTS